MDLGTLGGWSSVALDVNDLGQVVGSADTLDGKRHAYVWDDGVMTDLGTFGGGSQSEAWAGNNLGTAVGGSLRWDDGKVSPIGSGVQNAYGVNDSGDIVGKASFPGVGLHACLLLGNGTITDLGTFGGATSLAWDVNESGQVAGAAQTTAGPSHAFLWTNGELMDLGTLGGTVSEGLGINDAGLVVGHSRWTATTSSLRAFLWDGNQMIDLDNGQWTYSQAWSINNHRQVVGSEATEAEYRGFLHDPVHGVIDLQDSLVTNPGWTELNPRDINDAGQIVGAGTNPQGARRAFLMNRLPPIPAASSWTLAAMAGALLVAATVLMGKTTARGLAKS
jgi:probable HAF family extracellular repeat protein